MASGDRADADPIGDGALDPDGGLRGLVREASSQVREERAYQKIIKSGHRDRAAEAAFNLGNVLASRGHGKRACAAFQTAIDSGHPEWAPAAAFNLGELLDRRGDRGWRRDCVAASDRFRSPGVGSGGRACAGCASCEPWRCSRGPGRLGRAIGSGHTQYAPTAAINLGIILARNSDVPGAEAAYRQVTGSGHPELAPAAANNLGKLLYDARDENGARTAYQQALDSGHQRWTPAASISLGVLLHHRGDFEAAQAAYQQAIDSRDDEESPHAAYNLGNLLKEQGDVIGARAAFQQAIDSGHTKHAPKAAYNLGNLLSQMDASAAEARAAYELVIGSGDPDMSPMAAFNLGTCSGSKATSKERSPHTGRRTCPGTSLPVRQALVRSVPCSPSRAMPRNRALLTSALSTQDTATMRRERPQSRCAAQEARRSRRRTSRLPAGDRLPPPRHSPSRRLQSWSHAPAAGRPDRRSRCLPASD